MIKLLIIGFGGFLGSVMRYLMSGAIQRWAGGIGFPLGTFAVNLVGCLLIGVLGGLAENRQVFGPELRMFLLIGVLGGFTTFSTFGYETFNLLRDGQMVSATGNAVLQVILGVTAVWAGYSLTIIQN
jgi:CrcB protein